MRAASDLVAIVQETVELKPRGHEFWGCCPFHGEKTPSFHIIPATQVWHCFGCGEGGDVFTYIMKRENLSFPESIRYLADRAALSCTIPAPIASAAPSAPASMTCAPRPPSSITPCLCAVRTAVRASTLPAAVWARRLPPLLPGLRSGSQRAGVASVAGGLYPAGDDRRQRGREPWARAACRSFLRPRDVSHL